MLEPAEFLGGELCGTPRMVPTDAGRLIVTLTDGRQLLYRRTDLRSHKGCKVFRYAGCRT